MTNPTKHPSLEMSMLANIAIFALGVVVGVVVLLGVAAAAARLGSEPFDQVDVERL